MKEQLATSKPHPRVIVVARRWCGRAFLQTPFLVLLILAAWGARSESSPSVVPSIPDLSGQWYVLIHYRDLGGAELGPVLWDDEVWRFAQGPTGIRWTRYPHVAFEDETGRVERLSSGEEGRTTGPWRPNQSQRSEIEAGLELDDFERTEKWLRGSAKGDYRSQASPRSASASAVSFVAEWSIASKAEGPIFRRRDRLNSARARSAEGETSFETQWISDRADTMRGVFRRDGRFQGEFWLSRFPSATEGPKS